MSTKTFEIHVSRHEAKPDFYVARYYSPVLKAVYSVEFPGSVLGAVALYHFTEMLKTQAPNGGVTRFILPAQEPLTPVMADVLAMEHTTQ